MRTAGVIVLLIRIWQGNQVLQSGYTARYSVVLKPIPLSFRKRILSGRTPIGRTRGVFRDLSAKSQRNPCSWTHRAAE